MAAITRQSTNNTLALLDNDRVDPNQEDTNGNTALHSAACDGYAKSVLLLLDCSRVNPNLQNSQGRTPLHEAAGNGRDSVVELLLRRNQIKEGAVNTDLRDKASLSALGLASEKGMTRVVDLLLEAGAENLKILDVV